MKYAAVYKGEKVELTPIRTDDAAIESYVKWVNNIEIARYLGSAGKIKSFESCKQWAIEKAEICSREYLNFNIVDSHKGALIGNCSIKSVNFYGSFSLGILIGEPEYWGKGFGTDTISLLVKIAFEDLMAVRVRLTLSSLNERAYKCYSKCGFVECGREHKTDYVGGKWSDTVYMEILEYDSVKKVGISS